MIILGHPGVSLIPVTGRGSHDSLEVWTPSVKNAMSVP